MADLQLQRRRPRAVGLRMAHVQIACGAALSFAKVNDHVFTVFRHGSAIEPAVVHLVEILHLDFSLCSSRHKRKALFILALSSFDEQGAVLHNREYLVGAVIIKRSTQMYRGSPFTRLILARHPDVLTAVTAMLVFRVTIHKIIKGVAIR